MGLNEVANDGKMYGTLKVLWLLAVQQHQLTPNFELTVHILRSTTKLKRLTTSNKNITNLQIHPCCYWCCCCCCCCCCCLLFATSAYICASTDQPPPHKKTENFWAPWSLTSAIEAHETCDMSWFKWLIPGIPVCIYIYIIIYIWKSPPKTLEIKWSGVLSTWVFLHQLFVGGWSSTKKLWLVVEPTDLKNICNHQISSFLQGSGWKRTLTYLSCHHLDEERHPGILDRLVKHK